MNFAPAVVAVPESVSLRKVDLATARALLETCTDLLDTMQVIPQPIVARVHGLATAAGCQLVATADLAVAAESAAFAAPGGFKLLLACLQLRLNEFLGLVHPLPDARPLFSR